MATSVEQAERDLQAAREALERLRERIVAGDAGLGPADLRDATLHVEWLELQLEAARRAEIEGRQRKAREDAEQFIARVGTALPASIATVAQARQRAELALGGLLDAMAAYNARWAELNGERTRLQARPEVVATGLLEKVWQLDGFRVEGTSQIVQRAAPTGLLLELAAEVAASASPDHPRERNAIEAAHRLAREAAGDLTIYQAFELATAPPLPDLELVGLAEMGAVSIGGEGK